MADDQDTSSFADDEDNATQLLQGLISPAPAQALVAPPPDTPPRTRPGESTPLTGSLATAPSQATPKVDPAPAPTLSNVGPAPAYDLGRAAQLEEARNVDAIPINPNQETYKPGLGTKIRRGLAGYFSGGIGGAVNANYSAPNTQYAADEAARQARLKQDQAKLTSFHKTYDRQRQLVAARLKSGMNPVGQRQPDASIPDRSGDPNYVKVESNGQVGYLPKANLAKAQQRDRNLKVLR